MKYGRFKKNSLLRGVISTLKRGIKSAFIQIGALLKFVGILCEKNGKAVADNFASDLMKTIKKYTKEKWDGMNANDIIAVSPLSYHKKGGSLCRSFYSRRIYLR